MRFIDIEIAGHVFRAQLLETRSPHATEAVWNALPFEGRVAHGTWSGAIFRMLEHAPVDLTERERGIVFQNYSLLPWLSALKNVEFGVKARWPAWSKAQVREHSARYLSMVGLADEAERWLGKPVIAINAATWWMALRDNGVHEKVFGAGRLLREF